MLLKMNVDLGLGGSTFSHDLTLKFPSGSVVVLGGAESYQELIERYRGTEWHTVGVDEAQAYPDDNLIYMTREVLRPTLMTTNGVLIFSGTPGKIPKGYFHDASIGMKKTVRSFTWHTTDNPYAAEWWYEQVAELKEENPEVEKEPWFQREWMGKWVQDADMQVYKFRPAKNLIDSFKPNASTQYILGIDTGFEDPYAFVLCAYHKVGDRNFYVLEAQKKKGILIDEAAAVIMEYRNRYPNIQLVADPQNKNIIQEWVQRLNLPIRGAQKVDKAQYIDQFVNTDFSLSRIKVLNSPKTEPVKDEFMKLEWNDKGQERGENHCTDAFLYAYRTAYHWLAKQPRVRPVVNSKEFYKLEEQKMLEEAIQQSKAIQHKKENTKPTWKRR